MIPQMAQQYRQRKKRAVDPNAPPRPNLLGHDKIIRGQAADLESQKQEIARLESEMNRLRKKVLGLEQTVNQLISLLRKS
jgi:ATP-dependent protease ClpP protease subunit